MTHYLYPEMRLDKLFAVKALQAAMYQDSSPFARPMKFYVETPSEIRSMLDSNSYSKGKFLI